MSNSPGVARAIKRALDVVVAATGLIVVAPVLAIVAVAIRLESRGPALFRQVRVGRGFRRFEILKFRTMRVNAAEHGPLVTSAADSRITPLGRMLRRLKLDELPQLWNVLRGDMSLVGPRPEVPHYVELFREDYAEVLRVRPGITDLASLTFRDEEHILGGASDPELHYRTHVLPAKLALNKDYVRRASIGFDLEIILKTALEGVSLRCVPAREWIMRHPRPFVVGLHLFLIVASSYLAFWLRFDGDIPAPEQALWLRTILWLMIVRVPILALFRLFEGLWRYTSVHDLQSILAAVIGSELIFYVIVRIWLGEISFPRSVFIVDALLLVFLMGAVRLAKRFYESAGHLRPNRRVIVVGDWDRCDFVIRAMNSRVLGDYRPVGIFSTMGGALGRRIHGVPVLGTIENMPALVSKTVADEIILAYDRSVRGQDARVLAALGQLDLPARDAFELMVTVVNQQVPPGSVENKSGSPQAEPPTAGVARARS